MDYIFIFWAISSCFSIFFLSCLIYIFKNDFKTPTYDRSTTPVFLAPINKTNVMSFQHQSRVHRIYFPANNRISVKSRLKETGCLGCKVPSPKSIKYLPQMRNSSIRSYMYMILNLSYIKDFFIMSDSLYIIDVFILHIFRKWLPEIINSNLIDWCKRIIFYYMQSLQSIQ